MQMDPTVAQDCVVGSEAEGVPSSVVLLVALALALLGCLHYFPWDQLRSSLRFTAFLAAVLGQSFIVMEPKAEAAVAGLLPWGSLQRPLICGALAVLSVRYACGTCARVWKATNNKSHAMGSQVRVSWGLVITDPVVGRSYLQHLRRCDRETGWIQNSCMVLKISVAGMRLSFSAISDVRDGARVVLGVLFSGLAAVYVAQLLASPGTAAARGRAALWRFAVLACALCMNAASDKMVSESADTHGISATAFGVKGAAETLLMLTVASTGLQHMWATVLLSTVIPVVKSGLVTFRMASEQLSWEVHGQASTCCLFASVATVGFWLAHEYTQVGSDLQRLIYARVVQMRADTGR